MVQSNIKDRPTPNLAEAVLKALTETSELLSETAGHLVENAVPAEGETGVPTSFTEDEMPMARILSESAVPVARAAPVSSLAAPAFSQAVPQSAPT
jgi:hypothetical protein